VSVLVIAEQRDGAVNRATWEAIAAGQQLGAPVRIAVLGKGLDTVAGELAAAACEGVVVVDDDALEHYTGDGYVMALAALITAQAPDVVVFSHTYQTRDFAPALAARLQRPLVTDVTAFKQDGDRRLFVRPMFQGKLSADISASGPAPHLVTVQIGSFRADAVARGSAAAPIEKAAVPIDTAKIRQKPEAPFKEAKQAVDLSQAARIVSVGGGINGL
jgi:electron transfer flavoprotein alpha subunit